ncbi:MAG: hypothetical protein JXR25_00225 [Pontiellaceae bacterium]|nr:hypothetical protein [Pontiellaceae bacterium]MBN2783224.1 hypothetical protein [Pontiellaceae bacterium]
MKKILEIVSYLALLLVVAAPFMFYAGKWDLEQNKLWMLIATIVWFVTAAFWIGTEKKEGSSDDS